MPGIKFGFIGAGNMGGALATAVAKSVTGDQVIVADKSEIRAKSISRSINCETGDNYIVAENAKFIFLGIKPQMINEVLEDIKNILVNRKDRFILITMAAGIEIGRIEGILGGSYPIIRIMPNTPVCAGEGMILYTCNENVFMDEISEF